MICAILWRFRKGPRLHLISWHREVLQFCVAVIINEHDDVWRAFPKRYTICFVWNKFLVFCLQILSVTIPTQKYTGRQNICLLSFITPANSLHWIEGAKYFQNYIDFVFIILSATQENILIQELQKKYERNATAKSLHSGRDEDVTKSFQLSVIRGVT